MDNDRLGSLIQEIIDITGPGLDGDLPSALYDCSRRFCQTYCVDGVPVLDSGPSVVLSYRGSGAVLPNQWWVVGGRVPKGQLDETVVLEEKFRSELGASVEVSESDYIGRGRLIMSPHTSDNKRDFAINTPTAVYAVRVSEGARGSFSSGDGNEKYRVVPVQEIAVSESLHPYVRLSSVVAVDHIHGPEWRNSLGDSKNVGYPLPGEDLGDLSFIPLEMRNNPLLGG